MEAVWVEGSGAVVTGLQLAVLLTDGTVVVVVQVVLREQSSSREMTSHFLTLVGVWA